MLAYSLGSCTKRLSLASVEHEGLVPAYAVGQTDGVYYMVMKPAEGRPLSDILLEDERLDETAVGR